MNEKREFRIKTKEEPPLAEIVNELARRALKDRKLELRNRICQLTLMSQGYERLIPLSRTEQHFAGLIRTVLADWIDEIESQLSVMTPEAEDSEELREEEDFGKEQGGMAGQHRRTGSGRCSDSYVYDSPECGWEGPACGNL